MTANKPAPKTIATAMPPVVRGTSRFMQIFGPFVGKQSSPETQDEVATVVEMQVLPLDPEGLEHAYVEMVNGV